MITCGSFFLFSQLPIGSKSFFSRLRGDRVPFGLFSVNLWVLNIPKLNKWSGTIVHVYFTIEYNTSGTEEYMAFQFHRKAIMGKPHSLTFP